MLQTLREHFGFDALRAGQEPVIRALLDGRPALAVFPTGGGKSLCYQLPALLLDGLTLVISPLIALMKDQVDALTAKGVAAARLDSTLGADELRGLYEKLETGAIKLLYIAPERLANEAFRKRVKQLDIAMVAIDEAHCISEWGHNFRPDYLKLAKFCRSLKITRVLALTATATPKVAREIRRHFRIAAADHIQLSFHRPNLDLRVTPCEAAERKAILLDRLALIDGAAVVYVTRQETAEEVATFLAKQGVSARAYHAGLPDDFRAGAQSAFMAGETRVIVATIAFGMGIDKADIRGVIHYNLPKSLENHTQEIGRAGRDGLPAVCEMLACGDDLTVLENFIYSDTPSPRALGNLIDRVLRLGDTFDVSVYDLSVTCDIRTSVISTLLAYLETDGILEATGSFYGNYRLKLLRGTEQLLAGLAKNHRSFTAKLLEHGKPGRAWLGFEPTALAHELGVPRAKIVATLGALEAAGDAVLSLSGVRQGYRMKKDPGKLHDLADHYAQIFQRREQADLARLNQVLGIASHRGCLTGYLTKHFGESLPSPCGHCDRCRGLPANPIKRPAARKPTDGEWRSACALVRENHGELATPRQLARFLCGMSSPASTRARLGRHAAFGMFSDLPFADVLAMAEAL
ncbi:MAG: RecQ family ATP-dependent DNA helicase [Akkermansiaceae bacterium]|jgi:ATP-dependent DNA helicase RecQ|nr:RecQ family ATP-dependent DNA helicase [Akkermansiaceae bacterium]